MRHVLRATSGPALVLCAFVGGCGSAPTPVQPGSPPTPTAAPTPTSAGFLHVLQHPHVMTYEIDASGSVRLLAAQNTGDTQLLASDPRGRYVYAAHSAFRFGPGCGGVSGVVTYAPSRQGLLEAVSEVTDEVGDEWVALAAGTDRLHSVRSSKWGTTCRHTTYYYESLSVGTDGRLGGESAPRRFAFDNEAGLFYLDPRSDMLYKSGRTAAWDGLGGLAAHAIQKDGQLRHTGWTDLCGGRAMAESWDDWSAARPLAAVRGFVFASVPLADDGRTVCSYEGQRLKPVANLGFTASVAEAFVPDSESRPAWVAMGVSVPEGRKTRDELRLFSMDEGGALQLLDSAELSHGLQKLLFHPSGRFLYASDTAGALLVYAVGPEGRLEPIQTIDQVGESLAITLAPGP